MAVDRKKLAAAMADNDGSVQYFVDTHTGSISKVSLQDMAAIQKIKQDLQKDPKRYVRIPKRSGREKYADLEGFIKLIADVNLRGKLTECLGSPNPYRDIRLALERRYKEQRQYDAYQAQLVERRVEDFLRSTGLR